MREYLSAKNLLDQRRIQKKNPKNPKIQESRNSFNELRNKSKEINLDEYDEKTRLYNIENKANKLLEEFGGMKDDISDIKQNIEKMKDTMDTILLFTLSKDANCPYNQRIKINYILKKKEKISLVNLSKITLMMQITIRLMPIFQLIQFQLGK